VRLRRTLIALVLFSVGAASDAGPALAADFTVTNTDDAGAGSLRQALIGANAAAGADTIQFAVPGEGVKTINVSSDVLPEITGPVTMDGYTQPGASANSLPRASGTNTNLLVEISGRFSGLKVKTGSSTHQEPAWPAAPTGSKKACSSSRAQTTGWGEQRRPTATCSPAIRTPVSPWMRATPPRPPTKP
jgi:hypothetical protein